MNNTMLPKKEIELLTRILKDVDEFLEVHKNVVPDTSEKNFTKFNTVHTIMYLDFCKDFVSSAKALKVCLDMTEEDFVKTLKEHNATLDEFYEDGMIKALKDVLDYVSDLK